MLRFDGSVDFNRTWDEYKAGFGDPFGERWLGLENLYILTMNHNYGLYIDMTSSTGETFWAEYGQFTVGPEPDNYRLRVHDYNPESTAGDSLQIDSYGRHDGMAFSTYDRDNDLHSTAHCAREHGCGWWFKNCHLAQPTGKYLGYNEYGINWFTAYNNYHSFVRMRLILIHI